MDYIDIVEFMRINNNTLKNIICYGYIRDELPRPSNIFQNVITEDGGCFRRMTVFAMDLSSMKYELGQLGYTDDILFVKGDILVYVDKKMNYPDWYKIVGTLRFGTKEETNYVTLLNYAKYGNDWLIRKSVLSDFEITEKFPKRIRDTICGECILPSELDNLQSMQAVIENNEYLYSQDTSLPIPSYSNSEREITNIIADDREDIRDIGTKLVEYVRYLNLAESEFAEFTSKLKSSYSIYHENEYTMRLIHALKSNLKRRVGDKAVTGQSLLKGYFSTFGNYSDAESKKTVMSKLIYDYDICIEYMLYGTDTNFKAKAKHLCEKAFSDVETFYGGILTSLINIDFTFAVKYLNKKCLSFSKIVNENPYILSVFGLISFKDAELLGLLFGASHNPKLMRFKFMSLLHDYVMNSDSNSTCYSKQDLKNLYLNRVSVPMYASQNIEIFFTGKKVKEYPDEMWESHYGRYSYHLNMALAEQAYHDYLTIGLGVELDGFFTSTRILSKEWYILDALYKQRNLCSDLTTEAIDEKIDEYEEQLGFKLEAEQRKAVHLCTKNASCISGSAGSGKTTTVGCIVYVLSQLEPELDMLFAAPTGKAAKVLQGVVKRDAYTLNALCRIGMQEEIEDEDVEIEDDSESVKTKLYFVDEMSMVDLDLMYQVIKKLNGSRFIFIGDINQLSPIRKGLIFQTLLKFLPCVYLKVSKRSAESSGITYNSNLVNNYSERANFKQLEERDDMRIIECSDENIASTVKDICKYLVRGGDNTYNIKDMQGLTYDDIQVITPFNKASYSWGAKKLNQDLQTVFNPNYSYASVVDLKDMRFIIGDRVIHSVKNVYNMQWYETYENGVFRKAYGCGIMNGQVGRLVGVRKSTECIFEDEGERRPKGFSYPSNLRVDSNYNGEDKVFLIVEYEDYCTEKVFYILYRATLSNEKLFGGDTGYLDLFYAGSTHKMQGSQAKFVICCIGNAYFGSFLTRNMLYTMITRGSEMVILVGSKAQINKMRQCTDKHNVHTVGSVILEQ